MTFHLCEIAIPVADDIPLSWVATQTDELFRADAAEMTGVDDSYTSVRQRIPWMCDVEHRWITPLVAAQGVDVDALPRSPHGLPLLSWDAREVTVPEGQILATASVSGSLEDNAHTAYLGAYVIPEHRRHGIGAAFLAEGERISREHGCTTVLIWADHRGPVQGEPAFEATTSAGAVQPDGVTAFLAPRGYILEQCNSMQRIELPVENSRLAEVEQEARDHADGYSLRSFVGAIPEDLVEAYAALLTHFDTQYPRGGIELEPRVWDVERLRREEALREAEDEVTFTTVAIHDATGALVAATDITSNRSTDVAAFQQTTIVHADHRGHRLGLLVKAANLRLLMTEKPTVRRVATWNAMENEHMRRVNDQLGFHEVLVEGGWQKRLG